MKKSLVTRYAPTVQLARITKTIPRYLDQRKNAKKIEQLPTLTPPPTEEMVNQLNRIGMEYPFCIYYKAKSYDTL